MNNMDFLDYVNKIKLLNDENLVKLLRELCEHKPELLNTILNFAVQNTHFLRKRAEEKAEFYDKLILSYAPFVQFVDPNNKDVKIASQYLKEKLREGVYDGFINLENLSETERRVFRFINQVEGEEVFDV